MATNLREKTYACCKQGMEKSMRQYELAIRIAQVHHLVDERKYKKALAVIQTLDVRQVRALSDLKVFAEVYTKTEQYEAAKATYLRIYRRSRTRRVLYRLIYLSIRTNALEDAEAYYQEFVRMNPNARDALILRYRIDKASGVPIGQLIETLQELKQEEYIEEWAYELAKLYHRAGRREECLEECEDILLWFGTGEIVERAKILIDHLKEQDLMPYYDDKDFTVPRKEEPNPEDTGSLPDLNEFIKERKAQKKEERRVEKLARREEAYEDEYEDDYDGAEEEEDLVSFDKKEAFAEADTLDEELAAKTAKQVREREEAQKAASKKAENTFVDDYEEELFDEDGMDFSQMAKDGIQKLSDLLKLGKKEEERAEEPVIPVTKPEPEKPQRREKPKYIPHSQSGTGITQDLAKEISAIYEMEHREQLKEKAVTVINEMPNIATNVVDRMTQAIQKTAGRGYIPLDVEEIYGKADTIDLAKTKDVLAEKAAMDLAKTKDVLAPDELEEEAPVEDALTQMLDAEVEQYREENALTEAEESVQVSGEEQRSEAELLKDLLEEEIQDPDMEENETDFIVAEKEENETDFVAAESEEADSEELAAEETDSEEIETALEEETFEEETSEEEPEEVFEEEVFEEEPQMAKPSEDTLRLEEILRAEIAEITDEVQPEATEYEPEEMDYQAEPEENLEYQTETEDEFEEVETASEEETKAQIEEPETSNTASPLENYQAPEIPVVETEYMEMPEITYEDLPTTRALQQSFQNVLRLIAGELDPSHFVLMGDGTDRIVGVSKQIVRVMKDTGYLSQGRIAKIQANQLNKMDLISFRSQLKGNCLLIENAADLLFPTITKIFSIMEEYYGDFVVILADEGTTLDQLFRFVPVLAKKFKYIIDISKYTENDYK